MPLEISGHLILAASVHARHIDVDKISHLQNIFIVVDAIGKSTGCTAVVIGGDFNLDIKRDQNLNMF